MKRRTVAPLLAIAIALPSLASGAEIGAAGPQSIEQRINRDLGAADNKPAATQPLSISAGPPPAASADTDLSLTAPTGPQMLHTTLDPIGIEQRIDKGLTAAGEASAFPPDYAYGAYQRGWFLTAFSLALDRAKTGHDPAAETLLGLLLARGLGVKQDLAAAADWYRLAGQRRRPRGALRARPALSQRQRRQAGPRQGGGTLPQGRRPRPTRRRPRARLPAA